MCSSLASEQPCFIFISPSFPTSFLSHTTPIYADPHSHALNGNGSKRDGPSHKKTDFRLKKLHVFKGEERKDMIRVYKITDRIERRQTSTIANLSLISRWDGRQCNVVLLFSLSNMSSDQSSVPNVWLWTIHITSLRVSFPVYQLGMVIPLSQGYCEN